MENTIISLLGFMGCGKSSVGSALAELLGAGFTDLDVLVEEREGKSIPEIFAGGEDAFREAEFAALRSFLDSCPGAGRGLQVLSLGGGTVTRPEAAELVFSRTVGVYLDTSLEELKRRVDPRAGSRPLFSSADVLYEKRRPIYERAPFRVITDGLGIRQVAEKVRDILPSSLQDPALSRT